MSAALRYTNGDNAAARELLLGLLKKQLSAAEFCKWATTERLRSITESWAADSNSGLERLILPRFVPVLVGTSRTLAAAFVGSRYNATDYFAARSSRGWASPAARSA